MHQLTQLRTRLGQCSNKYAGGFPHCKNTAGSTLGQAPNLDSQAHTVTIFVDLGNISHHEAAISLGYLELSLRARKSSPPIGDIAEQMGVQERLLRATEWLHGRPPPQHVSLLTAQCCCCLVYVVDCTVLLLPGFCCCSVPLWARRQAAAACVGC